MDSGIHKIIVNITEQKLVKSLQLKMLVIIWFFSSERQVFKTHHNIWEIFKKNKSYSQLAITSHGRLYEDDKLSHSKWMHWKKEGWRHQLLSSPVRSGSLPSSSHVSWRAPELAV